LFAIGGAADRILGVDYIHPGSVGCVNAAQASKFGRFRRCKLSTGKTGSPTAPRTTTGTGDNFIIAGSWIARWSRRQRPDGWLGAQVVGHYTGSSSTAFSIDPLQVVASSFAGTPSRASDMWGFYQAKNIRSHEFQAYLMMASFHGGPSHHWISFVSHIGRSRSVKTS
jgi:hypothetical protein